MLKGTMINKNENFFTIDVDLNNLENDVQFRGYGDIKLIYTWVFDRFEILLYGWDNGHHNMVNRHELPDPLENILLFGDIIILQKENGNFVDFTKFDYEHFYNEQFDGFDMCDEEDDSDLENDDYDYEDDFIVRDDE